MCLSVCLIVCLSVCLFICLSVCLSVYLSTNIYVPLTHVFVRAGALDGDDIDGDDDDNVGGSGGGSGGGGGGGSSSSSSGGGRGGGRQGQGSDEEGEIYGTRGGGGRERDDDEDGELAYIFSSPFYSFLSPLLYTISSHILSPSSSFLWFQVKVTKVLLMVVKKALMNVSLGNNEKNCVHNDDRLVITYWHYPDPTIPSNPNPNLIHPIVTNSTPYLNLTNQTLSPSNAMHNHS